MDNKTPKENIGKIIIKGKILSISPIHIGCGSGDRSDLDILLDKNEMPFVPGTSLSGVLRHAISYDKHWKEKHKYFWGFNNEEDGQGSLFFCSDLTVSNESKAIGIKIRDGICIDNKTGITIDKSKYDYEVLEPGAEFDFQMEFTINKKYEDLVHSFASTIWNILISNNLQVGAKTVSGLGYIKVIKDKTKIYYYDFTKQNHVLNWLKIHNNYYAPENILPEEKLVQSLKIKDNSFKLKATFKIRHSLIIRSYSGEPEMPDYVHISSGKNWIITGTTIKGAIRSRAERILYSLDYSKCQVDIFMRNLFGYVDTHLKSNNSQKARIIVKESKLPAFIAEQQTRIKIDRFTGGTIESALLKTMPLFVNLNDEAINIEIEIKECKETEAGLLLLVLKDLWTGDLAMGGEKNIGRGTFEGIKGNLAYNGKKYDIDRDMSGQDIAKLQKDFIDKLVINSGDKK